MFVKHPETTWTPEEDSLLIELYDGFPAVSLEEMGCIITARFGHHKRTGSACGGRYWRIVKLSEEALEEAIRARQMREIEHRRILRDIPPPDPYQPRPEFFETPTPYEKRKADREAQERQRALKAMQVAALVPVAPEASPDAPQQPSGAVSVDASPRRFKVKYKTSWTGSRAWDSVHPPSMP